MLRLGMICDHIFQIAGRTAYQFVPTAGFIQLDALARIRDVRLAKDTVIHYIDYDDAYPGVTIPSDWKAVTMDHGTIHQWKLGTISQNPIGFTLCTLLLVSILAVLFWSIWFAARLKGYKRGQYYETPVA